jgi:uncharacterized protein YjiS (DUF1127 family)
MSTQIDSFPASAGTPMPFGSAIARRLARIWSRLTAIIREALDLRRTLNEIQWLNDRELLDIGLGSAEIHRLRRGDFFCPSAWDPKGTTRDHVL